MSRIKCRVASKEALTHLKFIRHKKQEYFVCFSLDSNGRLIKRRVVTIGLLDASLVHPRETFVGPLKDRAAAVIIAHNHPSGQTEPSSEDVKTTQQLVAAGQILGIPLYDHLIVTASEHYSFRENGLVLSISMHLEV
jgi:DNA repair protein RadC